MSDDFEYTSRVRHVDLVLESNGFAIIPAYAYPNGGRYPTLAAAVRSVDSAAVRRSGTTR